MDEQSKKFIELFGSQSKVSRFFCPGRVNLMGEHIDYLGGSVLPTAISLGITALIKPNNSKVIRLYSTNFDELVTLDLTNLPHVKQHHWSDFVLGVVRFLTQKGTALAGCDVLLDSNLPQGSGLSSSAALEVLCYYMFVSVFTADAINRVQLAADCQQIENNFIGVNCGIMDQFAVANGKANHAIMLHCQSLEHTFIPLNLGQYSLLIINTNKARTLAQSAYNQRRETCEQALQIIAQHKQIDTLVNATLDDLQWLNNTTLEKRTRHAITEQLRVKQSAAAWRAGNLAAVGKLMNQSHASLQTDYEVSCAELDWIVAAFQQHKMCLGARMTGAGFGGCCIALVQTASANSMVQEVTQLYENEFGMEPTFYHCKPANGVTRKSA